MSTNSEWLKRLKEVECRDSTYRPREYPIVFDRANGSLVWDVEGREYIDLCAGFGALALGHASQSLQEVAADFVNSQPMIEHGMGDVYPSKEKIQFLEQLKSMLPSSYGRGALALSGGQAVEIALKTAILSTGNSGVIVFEGGYHGLDLGVLPLVSREDFRTPFKGWLSENNVRRIPYGCSMDVVYDAISSLGPLKLGAVVVEPIQGRAGVRIPPLGWLNQLAETTHENLGLLVLDEIFTGFGRIGAITTSESVDADILCFGKAIGGGFPISACFAKNAIMDAWPESTGEAIHTGTFFGHAFSAAVGMRTLKEITGQNLSIRSKILGDQLVQKLTASLSSSAAFIAVRGQGLFVGIEFKQIGYAAKMMDRLRAEGIIVLPSGQDGRVLSITPALNIPENLLNDAINKIVQMVHKN